MTKAAKDCYLKSLHGHQIALGNRTTFQSQLHQSRNYWVHYGENNHNDILTGRDLSDLNEKLR